jgi:hypothetical protein
MFKNSPSLPTGQQFNYDPFPQAVGGIVFAIAYKVEGNLMVPITIHVLSNTAIFALSLMA